MRPTVFIDSRKKALRDLDAATSDDDPSAIDSEFDPDKSLVVWSRSRRRGERVVILGEFATSVYADYLADPKFRKVYSDYKADARIFYKLGINTDRSFHADIVSLDWQRDENAKKHGLKEQVHRYFRRRRKGFGELFSYVPPGKKKALPLTASQVFGFAPLPDDALLARSAEEWRLLGEEYSGDDAEDTVLLYWSHRKDLERVGYWPTYLRMDRPYTLTLMRCEERGIPIDMDGLRAIGHRAAVCQLRTEHVFKTSIGHPEINLNAKDKLRPILLEELGWEEHEDLRTPKTQEQQINKQALWRWAKTEPLATTLLRRGVYAKLVRDVRSFERGMDPDGRLRTDLNQQGTRCLAINELVLTARGYRRVQHVHVGDFVMTHKGRPRRVSDVFENGIKKIYVVVLENGLSLRTTGNHPFLVGDRWVEAASLAIGDDVTTHANSAETWKKIPGWDYMVSTWGRVQNFHGRRPMGLFPKGVWGHLGVALWKGGVKKEFAVHRLVAQAFLPEPADGEEIRHLNGYAWDNDVRNLKWGTAVENRQDAVSHGTMSWRGSDRAKLTEEAVAFIRTFPFQKDFDRDLASLLGVSKEIVRDVRLGKRWEPEPLREKKALFTSSHVVSVDLCAKEMTYGLTVDGDESHVTGGIVTHNTGRCSSKKRKDRVFVEKRNRRKEVVLVQKTVQKGGNLQNIVSAGEKDPWGVKKQFVAPKKGQIDARGRVAKEDYKLCVIDMAGFELVISIHWAKVFSKRASALFETMQRYGSPSACHALTAINAFPQIGLTMDDWELVKKLFPDLYRIAKEMNFGLCYGGTEYTLARRRRQDTRDEAVLEENARLVDRFFEMYPELVDMQKALVNHGYEHGWVPTIAGGRIHVARGLASIDKYERAHWERNCMNGPVQRSAAEVLKVAMNSIEADEELADRGYSQLIQVHDEVVGESPGSQAQWCLDRAIGHMEGGFLAKRFLVKLKADGGIGDNWGSAKP